MSFLLANPMLFALAVISLLNLVLVLICFWQFRRYRKLQEELLAGEEVESLEAIVLKQKKTLASHHKNLKGLGEILGELVENNKLNVKKVGLVRFNPFAETGGNFSFAVALLDGHNSGIVISSLHGREGTRTYAKPIENGSSKHHLTQEEKEAIESAKSKVQNSK